MEHEPLTRQIIGLAMRVHSTLGPGFLESVYQNALTCELRSAGRLVECGQRIAVRYHEQIVGEFVADLVVDQLVIVELKSAVALVASHEAQLVNYLVATGIDVGLLINFGASSIEVRRKSRTYRPSGAGPKRL